jgi:hypothetical protein
MRLRDVARVVFSARVVSTVAIAGAIGLVGVSCGGSGSSSGNGQPDGSTGLHLGGDSGGGSHCKAATCASAGYTCGDNTDGCGGVLHCGTCTKAGDICGGGGFSKCGNPTTTDGGTCMKKTCATLPAGTCGPQADGCGGITDTCAVSDAALCPTGQTCGGGGRGLCGVLSTDGGDSGVCTLLTCADYATGTCGQQSDGCGSLTADCGGCNNPQFCGGDTSKPSQCGGNNGLGADGGPINPPCMRATCATLPTGTCGLQGDGCGGTVGPCTTCNSPDFCGGGGPSQCGGGDAGTGSSSGGGGDGGASCTPKTCNDFPGTCGQQSDGCGGLTANCGTCTNPQFCGGGGASTCGGNNGLNPDGSIISTCKPDTCSSKGYNCGQSGDGCGGIIGPCGPACTAPLACGAGGQPNVCGQNTSCTALCPLQKLCDGGIATLSGTVVAGTLTAYLPAGVANGDPVPNVLVYIPNSTTGPSYGVQPFTTRANETHAQQCSTCGADVTGNPLVKTTTKFDGTFTLSNVPVGTTIPVVIQLGRWRRIFTVSTACGTNMVNATGMPAGVLRMPRNQTEGDIPLTAISTGDVDAIECVLLKMGVDAAEFVAYSGTATGRIQLYQGNGAVASSGGTTPPETTLMGTSTTTGTYNNYDQVILPCWGVDPTTAGSANAKSAAELTNLVTYGGNGGHFFATHYSYAWLYANNPYSTTANWNVNRNTAINSMNGTVSQSVPPTTPVTTPGVFVEWLNYIKALNTNTTPPAAPPNPALVTIANARHDVNSVVTPSADWIDGQDPGHNNEAMLLHYTFDTPVGSTSQCGHAIFSDFHVTNSATGADQCQQNSDCPSGTCSKLNATCTQNSDCGTAGRCGNGGTCNRGTCNVAAFPSQSTAYCGTTMTAQEKILEYMIWDLAQCVPGQPTSTCTPKTCADFPAATCGQQGDGCGNLTPDCNPCPSGQACGACGTPGVCCAPDGGTCAKKTCNDYQNLCGQQSDGCGGLTSDCQCPTGQTCGGGGVPGQCGAPSDGGSTSGCVPFTCSHYAAGTCGQQADGCGGLTPDCNPCPSGQTCGGCGVSGMCCTPPSSGCTPQGCPAGQECGPASNGCGGIIQSCGTCTPPQTCGGGGVAGKCGGMSGCHPVTCADQGITCGPAGDGCGNLIPSGCGACPEAGGCKAKTCADQGIQCGPAGDGCGNLIPSCGSCTPPATCGGAGVPGVCGAPTAM